MSALRRVPLSLRLLFSSSTHSIFFFCVSSYSLFFNFFCLLFFFFFFSLLSSFLLSLLCSHFSFSVSPSCCVYSVMDLPIFCALLSSIGDALKLVVLQTQALTVGLEAPMPASSIRPHKYESRTYAWQQLNRKLDTQLLINDQCGWRQDC